jgi:ankyrin repeat protein
LKKAAAKVLLAFVVVTFLEAAVQKSEDLNKDLRAAIIFGKIDEAKRLIEAGVDVNKRFNLRASRNITPLYLAVMSGQADIGKLLIESGADVNIEYDGVNLLHVAALYRGNKAVAELLIAKGLDVNAKCAAHGKAKDTTPLHAAAGKGNIAVAEELIKNGAELDAKVFENHYTPLHVAARNNKNAVAELLIAKGAEVNAMTKHRETSLDLAISNGNEELADLLRKHGGISGESR